MIEEARRFERAIVPLGGSKMKATEEWVKKHKQDWPPPNWILRNAQYAHVDLSGQGHGSAVYTLHIVEHDHTLDDEEEGYMLSHLLTVCRTWFEYPEECDTYTFTGNAKSTEADWTPDRVCPKCLQGFTSGSMAYIVAQDKGGREYEEHKKLKALVAATHEESTKG